MANDTQSAITQTADFLRKSLRLIVITNHIAKINDRYRPKAAAQILVIMVIRLRITPGAHH